MTISDMLAGLDAPDAESWIPEPGDVLVLRVDAISYHDGGYGEYPVLSGAVQEGSTLEGKALELPQARALHCLGRVMQGEIGWDSDSNRWGEDRKVRNGSLVAVKFVGEKTSTAGNVYKHYKVIVENPTLADKLEDDAGIFSS